MLSLLSLRGISLRNIREGRETVFTVDKEDYPAVQELLQKNGKKVAVVKDLSFRGFLQIAGARSGIFFGLILFGFALFIYGTSVTRYTVTGNENVSSDILNEVIEEEISFPTVRSEVELSCLKKRICKVDGIADASVFLQGNVLCVEVREELPLRGEEEEKDIVALFDGVLEKVTVFRGEARKKVGDTVRKGEVLIRKTDEGCEGEVYGRAWIGRRLVYMPTEIVTERTGRSVAEYGQSSGCGAFSLFEKEEEQVLLPFSVPIYTKKTVYYELREIEKEVNFEKNKEEIISRETEKLCNSLPSDCEKVKTWFFVKTVDKTTVLDIYYEIRIKLSS